MFGAMTSLTGGGGLSSSSSAYAGGNDQFSNGFNYKNDKGSMNQTIVFVALSFVVGFAVAKAV